MGAMEVVYTKSHEWIQVEGRVGTVGITEYAQRELGEIVYIELPTIGEVIPSGKEACILESTKAAADVYAPVSGKIVAVNEKLSHEPSILNHHAEGAGWLFKLELSNPKELEKLLSRKEYQKFISS